MADIGRLLIFIGLSIAVTGVVILLATRYLPWLGNLPGDIRVEGENYKVYFPLATMILISVIGTILLNLIVRFFRR